MPTVYDLQNITDLYTMELFLSSFCTPDRYRKLQQQSKWLDEKLFIKNLPKEFASDEEWVNDYKKRIKYDSLCFKTVQIDLSPYDKPIYSFIATDDEIFDKDSVKAWKKFTTSKFESKVIKGGHFDILNEENRIILLHYIENIMKED